MTRYLEPRPLDQLLAWLKFDEEARRVIEQINRQIAAVLGIPRAMLERTPVDTGRARLQWAEATQFCSEKWGKHSCYLDKGHSSSHVCGFCDEGHTHPDEVKL